MCTGDNERQLFNENKYPSVAVRRISVREKFTFAGGRREEKYKKEKKGKKRMARAAMGGERLAAAGATRARDPSTRGAVLLPGVSGREAARVGQGCVLVGSDVTGAVR